MGTTTALAANVEQQYDCIYLSPHPDDAVFSAGASIARRITGGESVLVVTVCTGTPKRSASAFAASLHHRWGLADAEVVASRLTENDHALHALGVDSECLGFLDAIYRLPAAYDGWEGLFGAICHDDPLPNALSCAVDDLCRRYPAAWLCAPLAVAQHVDHQAAHLAARRMQRSGRQVTFYEDLPYAFEPGAVDRRLEQLGVASQSISVKEDVEKFLPSSSTRCACTPARCGTCLTCPQRPSPMRANWLAAQAPSSEPGCLPSARRSTRASRNRPIK